MTVDLESFEDLANALLAGCDDDGPHRAAVELLVETRAWLEDKAFVAEYILSREEEVAAWVDWEPSRPTCTGGPGVEEDCYRI
ncbi:hypothetical protein NI17_009940 [Thermobifida halotolerans]|uniref:Uncharacterized protein n=1 Tax=Thermobifida halotolerans TaxID=483545 RepID=A0A399G000_9ACTN|nr:hypothetical protein [Thermobifida halotolerans]UOE21400.1 hypothetical protein NI17_009940 [Thermobifida halotolerans]